MLSVSGETEGIIVPKLILQPVVENSYIHGIKPRGMKGRIAIETRIEGSDVKNVYDRIRLLYGEGYSLSVDSSVGVGTVVTITLPLMRAVQ